MNEELPLPELAPELRSWLEGERSRVEVAEAVGSSAALLLAALIPESPGPALVLTPRDGDADDLVLDLCTLRPGLNVVRLPEPPQHGDDSPEARMLLSARERALKTAHADAAASAIVASLPAVAAPCGDPARAKAERREVRVGQEIDLELLRRELFDAGLQPAPLVGAPGEMSFRGDIIDFFPLGSAAPLRLECFDQEVESIRSFDPESQRSTDPIEVAVLPPAGKRKLVQGGQRFTVLDHFAREPRVVRVDPTSLQIRLERESEAGNPSVADWMRSDERLAAFPTMNLSPRIEAGSDLCLGARAVEGSGGVEDLARWARTLPPEVKTLHLFSNTAPEGKRLTKLLRQHLPGSPRRAVKDQRGNLARGFILPSLGLWVANHHEVLSRTRLRRVEKSEAPASRPVKEALELSPGDYVVHLTHGVALYRGTRSHSSDAGTEDYLILEFAEGTLLYVPASKIELLSRYIGAGGAPPRLDKIGGKSWSRKKVSVEEALDEVADDLLELQAKRRFKPGFAFEPDDEMQADFEASFPYADTADQVTSVEEIKRDMEAPRPMDRLLCGDVGFGKTEVAVRAAFKCASQGRQVAVLAPTTLLVRQHIETFRNRMADYPLRIAGLSRITASRKSLETLEEMKSGQVDVVIGTHRLLSKKVAFKDLGLLIIDEEQRFGVRHKEALKLLKTEVDVLTLSATPIPRTLHMALVGLREISTLRIPPRGRQPIETKVTYESDALIREVIERELDREGQVFYIFNRVGSIQERAAKVMKLVPRARVGVAHGQLPARQLERVALAFQRGELDVLVCTTIIESGIDIPRVNTLIADRSDLLGLSDLHQLRGRIGRSERKARAYFLIPRKPLPASSLKRLRALEGLSHLGAGFDLAIRDLEIRGAGNLLGSKQSGHIEAVGYELYCRLLAKAVARRKGTKPPPEPEEIDVSLGLSAFLPREYVRSTHQRMGLLRRLGEARGGDEIDALAAELRDRFGRMPAPARGLLDVFRLKDCCRRYGIARIFHSGGSEILVNVRDLRDFATAPLGGGEARWIEGQRLVLHLPGQVKTPEQTLAHLLARFADGDAGSVPLADASVAKSPASGDDEGTRAKVAAPGRKRKRRRARTKLGQIRQRNDGGRGRDGGGAE